MFWKIFLLGNEIGVVAATENGKREEEPYLQGLEIWLADRQKR